MPRCPPLNPAGGSHEKSESVFILTILAFLCITPALAGTIVEQWDLVQPPAPVELKTATVSAANTALLVLDIEELTCNMKARPRCVESAPRIGAFLAKARAAGMPVVHSLTSRGTIESILPRPSHCLANPLSSPLWTNFSTRNLKTS